MYIDKIIKKETITLLISVGLLLIIFIGVSFASFFKIDEGKDNVVETGDLNISFCNDSTCDTTYENIGQVIGTTKQDGTSVPTSIYPYPNDGTYSNATPYIFKVTNTGTMDATITIKLKEDEDFLPTGDYSEYQRLTSLYSEHLKVAVRKKVLATGSEYQLGDANLDGIVNYDDCMTIFDISNGDIEANDVQKITADVTCDGVVDLEDAALILDAINGYNGYNEFKANTISSFSTLSNNTIYSGDKIAPGESATYFLWLYMDETTPNQAQKTYFVGNLNIEGEFVPDNIPFSEASWSQIIKNVKAGNISEYNVGDTKEVDLGTYGKHTLRIANVSTPSECSTTGFSQTACGFVLEFADVIMKEKMNDTATNKGGWPASSLHTLINQDLYNALPIDLKDGIITTKVVSGYGSSETSNFTSYDKLYLLVPKEIFNDWTNSYDSSSSLTRQLDYYQKNNISTSSCSAISKTMINSTNYETWWLRSAHISSGNQFFALSGDCNWMGMFSNIETGVSPAFRIG